MSLQTEVMSNPTDDAHRLSGFGRILRRTSLDELPQLFNILKGHMSFVGPRPLLPEYTPRYSDFQRQRLIVKPGLTGLAQINGRNELSWEQKFIYDVEYTQSIGFRTDMSILLKTLVRLLKATSSSPSEFASAAEFKGNDSE